MEPGSVDSIIPAVPGQLLDQLIAYPDPGAFAPAVKRLARLYRDYLRFASPPFISERLQLTAEVRLQSELYLPLAEIAAVFRRLYCATLTYPPLFASTPFHNPLSWADLFVSLPDCYQTSPDPSRLLQRLLDDRQQLIGFMLHSFLPLRFYGRRWRYPGQLEQIRAWLASNGRRSGLRLLDAACGTGEGGSISWVYCCNPGGLWMITSLRGGRWNRWRSGWRMHGKRHLLNALRPLFRQLLPGWMAGNIMTGLSSAVVTCWLRSVLMVWNRTI